jgi:hypothetical protein
MGNMKVEWENVEFREITDACEHRHPARCRSEE